jgi:hypothetical protein
VGWFVDLINETIPQGSAPAARLRGVLKCASCTSSHPPIPRGLLGAQVRIADGQLSVVDGPFVETKEVIGGYAIFELPGKEEAVASAVEFMQLHRDLMPGWEGTCEVRTFMGP